MATKMKGICKGIKCISQIFVVKDREMEIGYPTDVKHVAHIGWDNQSANGPTWMNEFKGSSDFDSIGGETDPSYVPISSWSSQDFDDQSMGRQQASEMFNDETARKDPKAPKKHKRKKTKSTSSPKSSASLRSTTKAPKPKTSFASTVAEVENTPRPQGLML